MTQSFSFGFASDDILEGDGDETVEVGPSHHTDTSTNKPVTVTEPKLHKLPDLV